MINGYIYGQIQRGCSARTINNRLKALRRLLHYYKSKYKEAYQIPILPMQREHSANRGPLSDREVCMLIQHFSPDDADSVLVAFILDTGVRSKSARNVRVEDIDLAGGTVTIRVTKNHEQIVLPLSAALRDLLGKYLARVGAESGYLFRNRSNGKLYDRSSIYKRVNRYLKKCGVQRQGVHLFRYTFGKIMVENNCNAMLLQKWFGHKTMEETKKYVKLYSNELQAACEYVVPLGACGKISKILPANS